MTATGLRVGVAFGGRSVEHDVSIITGLQALEVLGERHQPVPIYISRSGRWFTGEALRDLASYQADGGDPDATGRDGREPDGEEVHFDLHNGRLLRAASGGSLLRRRSPGDPIELDVVVLATHGTQGEDGCLQGALELARLPYVGPPVGAAAAAMDKATTKAILAQAGLPALDHLAVRREQWESDRGAVTAQIAERFPFPLYVKPASLGSSVGVSRCASPGELNDALELAFELDRLCLAEPAIEGGIEVNCAAIGRPGVEPQASVCEQPVAAEGFLSFEDKYMRGAKGAEGMKGAQRLIPAPIDHALAERLQGLTRQTFAAFGCAGVTRVDFLIDSAGQPYVNECNTIPGSFSFYLWEPAGLPFADLMDRLIELALDDHREKLRTTTVFDTNLLAQRSVGAKSQGKA
jgi:D-alanine-D-alanine ligase